MNGISHSRKRASADRVFEDRPEHRGIDLLARRQLLGRNRVQLVEQLAQMRRAAQLDGRIDVRQIVGRLGLAARILEIAGLLASHVDSRRRAP